MLSPCIKKKLFIILIIILVYILFLKDFISTKTKKIIKKYKKVPQYLNYCIKQCNLFNNKFSYNVDNCEIICKRKKKYNYHNKYLTQY